jgi:hypothetical protein
MSLTGRGAVTIWNDVAWAGRDVFYRWHDEEHIPERVGIEGFLRGRRYIRLEAEIEWFTLYETTDVGVLSSDAYLARLNDPTPLTREAVAHFFNVTRGLGDVVVSEGEADGGHLLAAAWNGTPDTSQRQALIGLVRDRLARLAGICAAHLVISDRAASETETAERAARSNANEIPDVVILIEAGRASSLAPALAEIEAQADRFAGLSVLRPPGTYRLEYQLRSG